MLKTMNRTAGIFGFGALVLAVICLTGPVALAVKELDLEFAEDAAGNQLVAARRLSLQERSDTVVDNVITIVGRWGDYVHGKSYQQEALVTCNGWQYTTYYDAERRLCVARRVLPAGEWQRIVFPDYRYLGDDNHNVPVLGICRADGTIHLAFDHHGGALRYRVSAVNAANNPAGMTWDASLFGPVVDSLVPGERITGVTYPRFVMAPDQALYFFYRVGSAVDGRMWMSRYEPSSGGWAAPWQITESAGSYTVDGKTSPSRHAYQNNPCVDADGRIHLSWIWREGGALANVQHDLCYMVSDDGGKTFRNHRGEMVTKGDVRAGLNAPDITVWPIGPRRGLKNQQAMAVDSAGRPHIVMWYLADAAPDIGLGAKDHTKSKYHHFWQTADGKWHKQELPLALSRDEWTLRPQLAFGRDDQLFLVYNRDGSIAVAAATRAGGFTDWRLIGERSGNFTGEAKMDIQRLQDENILSVYMHQIPDKAHEATPLHVVDFKVDIPLPDQSKTDLELRPVVRDKEVAAEHAAIGIDPKHRPIPGHQRTQHPDAQWFPDAGLGLFLHWDPACTRPINIGWSMIPGRKLLDVEITPAEFERIVREQDFNLDGKKWPITPNEYWALANDFKPDNYHPEAWLKKAKEAGFTYAVLTTKHHAGFAMWPSAFGDYNTKNYMDGRDLVKEYVEACRKVGLKVGLYFSGPDWYFERDFRNFLYRPLPGLPALDPDLKPRTTSRTPEEIAAHQKAYAKMVRGQVEELLTNYGKIDLLWFDGRPPIPDATNVIPQERIRELQPGIVINTRMHGKGDYITPERRLPETLRLKSDEWGEFCSPWNYWSYVKHPFRPLNVILTELVRSRHAGVNYLLGFGPMPNGDWAPEAYENVAKLAAWMQINGEAIYGTRVLPEGENASVLASAKGDIRYLYLVPDQTEGPVSVSFTGWRGDCQARLLGDTQTLEVTQIGDAVTVVVPAEALGETVRVLELSPR